MDIMIGKKDHHSKSTQRTFKRVKHHTCRKNAYIPLPQATNWEPFHKKAEPVQIAELAGKNAPSDN